MRLNKQIYYTPNDRDLSGGHQLHKESPVKIHFQGKEQNSLTKQRELIDQSVTNYTACEDNEISKISDVKDFTDRLIIFKN